MNENFLKTLNELSTNSVVNFIVKTKDEISIEEKTKQVVRDLSWIEQIEKTIPFIDGIVRSPRSFIVQEEEILPVEKTKKVTKESIKHLATHTSLIQDVDEDNNVKPLKLLNIFKEETTDLYENRFIYSLVRNTRTFLNNQLTKETEDTSATSTKIVKYHSETKINAQKVEVDLTIKNTTKHNSVDDSLSEEMEVRIQKTIEIFDFFLESKFMKELSNVVPVRSPIRKTNVILKEKNFMKCVELWEFLEKYNTEETLTVTEKSKMIDPQDSADMFKVGSFLEYRAIDHINTHKNNKAINYSREYIAVMIEKYLDENDESEAKFKKILLEEFKRIKEKKIRTHQIILEELKNNQLDLNNRYKKAMKLLD